MPATTVFISYSFDSEQHVDRVRAFAARLKADGVGVRLDTDVDLDPPEGWPTYSQNQIESADYVVLVCTETYCRRFDGREEPGRGKGVTFESRIIKQEIFNFPERIQKFIPVVFHVADIVHIPTVLRDRGRYDVSQDLDSAPALGYKSLLRRLGKSASQGQSAMQSSPAQKPSRNTMPSHQFNARRLHELEELLDIQYDISHEFEKQIAIADGASRITLKQRFKREVTPELRKLEQEYAELLADGVPAEAIHEADADALVGELSKATNTILQSVPANAPQEMVRLLGEIKAKLSEPNESASAKLKLSLPLIPAICSYEIEVETAGLLKKVWLKTRDFFKSLVPK